jgi:hypothetical protein
MEAILNHPWVLGLTLAIILALALELGHRVAVYTSLHKDQDRKDQMATIRDGLFVLVSLLLGFTLALASPRYAERRLLVVEEAISIGTTYLRTSTLPSPQREHSQLLLREYIDACLEFGNAGLDADRFAKAMHHARRIQEELWADAASVIQIDRSAITAVYINSLNETIDLHDKRMAALENRVPQSVSLLILCISLIAVFARGLTLPARFWFTLILVPITVAIVVALIADLDTPSSGLIRLDQRPLERLKADLNAEPTH